MSLGIGANLPAILRICLLFFSFPVVADGRVRRGAGTFDLLLFPKTSPREPLQINFVLWVKKNVPRASIKCLASELLRVLV